MDKVDIKYTYDEVLPLATEYFKGDELSAKVWINKYALKDSHGNIFEKTPEDMHRRISSELARIEKNYPNPLEEETIFEILDKFKYVIPQGSPMSGIGNNYQVVSLSNCFVVGDDKPSDSYGGILKTDEEQVQLMKRRGGVGHDLSHLRPAGSVVHNSALTSTGIVPFMERYSNSTREVAQDGRRGALMLTISIDHMDSEAFIDAKMTGNKVTGANVSVKMSDSFMNAVFNNEKHLQKFPIDSDTPIYSKEVEAKPLWKKIIHNAWASAEPGILFWDKIISESPADCYSDVGFKTISTNPCGEIPLCANDSCRLLAINLYSYVENPFTEDAKFNFDLFKKHIYIVVKIMDDIVDLEIEKIKTIIEKIKNDPEDEQVKTTELNLWNKILTKTINGRRTGIGITAEGDMLAALNLQYASESAIEFSEKIHKILATTSYFSSVQLAKDRGAFPIWDFYKEFPSYKNGEGEGIKDKNNNPFLARIFNELIEEYGDGRLLWSDYQKYGRRNISMLTIAPTGSVSMMTQTTSGIEPVFMVSYKRRRKINPNDKNTKISFTDESGDSWEEYNVFHPKFLKWLIINKYDVDKIKNYTDEELDPIIKKSPYYKSTSNDVDWVAKVKMQGKIQQWVDHSISVTVNLPEDITEDVVSKVYETAWRSGCKGITVYRDGSRTGVLIKNTQENKLIIKTNAPKRPKALSCNIHHITALGKQWVVIVGLLEGEPYEVFAFQEKNISISKTVLNGKLIKVKSGHYSLELEDGGYLDNINALFARAEEEALTRMISVSLRHGANIKFIVDQLNKSEGNVVSFGKAIARTLKRYLKDENDILKDKSCPECGDPNGLIYEDGCLKCKSCTYSKCG